MCEEASFALIWGLKRRPFDRVKKEVHAQIVYEVGESPDHRYAGEGNAEQDDVQEADAQDVGEPHPSAVHHPGVWVHLAVRCAHVHDGGGATSKEPGSAEKDGFNSDLYWLQSVITLLVLSV